MWREWETLEHSVLNGMTPSKPFPQDSGIYAEEETERLREPKMMVNSKETVFSRHNEADEPIKS